MDKAYTPEFCDQIYTIFSSLNAKMTERIAFAIIAAAIPKDGIKQAHTAHSMEAKAVNDIKALSLINIKLFNYLYIVVVHCR